MKKTILGLGILITISCTKTETPEVVVAKPTSPVVIQPSVIVYPSNTLDSFSVINKTTSWYTTTRAMTQLFDVFFSKYWGFESLANGILVPYNTSTTNTWSASKSYYWNDLGTYLYTDFNGDGRKDLWAYYWKNPCSN